MTQDELIIEQFDNFLKTGEINFFFNSPIIKRLQEIGLIKDIPEPTENIKQIALGKIITSRTITDFDKMAAKNSRLTHRMIRIRADNINQRLIIKQVFQKLKDENRHIGEYLKR